MGHPDVPRVARKVPLYVNIASTLAGRIRSGEFAPQWAIPSEKVVMREFSVAKVTARQAVARLREQGWVFTIAHRGTYVADPEDWPDVPHC
ncbi:GntR family transcriptional regulator [Nonomuraea montanisoli]|uniref:GntR family transcriptional regulator n=1 Tax=Nonomuraea montanisoli TaxID=2741721 RepID=UPI002E2A9D21|nr:GntR family transcriptional regulator [Nonomuraea montanisoli]